MKSRRRLSLGFDLFAQRVRDMRRDCFIRKVE